MKERGLYFFFLCILLVGAGIVIFIPEPYVERVINQERADNYAFLGTDTASHTEARANHWYDTLFVNTGLTDITMGLTDDAKPLEDPRMSKVNSISRQGLDWWDSRIRVIWRTLHQFLVRLSVLLVWVPFALLIIMPFMVDSLVSRKIRATNFAIPSPHLQLIGARSMVWMIILFLIVQIMPLRLHPAWGPTVILLFSGSLWLAVANFSKRG